MFVQSTPSVITICLFLVQYLATLALAQAPKLPEPGAKITDEQLNATYTHLVGFEGCELLVQPGIVQAFWDAAAVLNRQDLRNSFGDPGINWHGPAAVEYLGAPFSQPAQGIIQDLYTHAATFEPSYVHWPTDFTINARCDDPERRCECPDTDVYAYARNTGGSNNNGPYINFCPDFHPLQDLATAVQTVTTRPPDIKYDMDNYENKAHVFMHEMFHIDRISSAPPNQHVTDVWIQWEDDQWDPAYGPELVKVLARAQSNVGSYIIQNADSLMLFAFVTYYQSVLGEYPSRPFALDVPIGNPIPHRPYSFFNIKDHKLEPNLKNNLNKTAVTVAPASGTCLGGPIVTLDARKVKFAENEDYPPDYQSSLNSYRFTWEEFWAPQTSFPSLSFATATAITTKGELMSLLTLPQNRQSEVTPSRCGFFDSLGTCNYGWNETELNVLEGMSWKAAYAVWVYTPVL